MQYSQNDFYQIAPELLVKQALDRNSGQLSDTGALCINTGKFTGRSPENKFIVNDSTTSHLIDWNHFNLPTSKSVFDNLKTKIIDYIKNLPEAWVRDGYACTDTEDRLALRVVTETPWSSLFCYNMFLRPTPEELKTFNYQWIVYQAPSFLANPKIDGVPNENFAIISFEEKTIIIGGTAYTGEIKKGIFSVLNCELPSSKKILSMHCSANLGKQNDLALFFGLSGTGKTTLSADPDRILIGDDEHGWADNKVFNFEGGCYAKTIRLDPIKEADIYQAIKPGALLENTVFYPNTNTVNFADESITQNTRVSYPLFFIKNSTPEVYQGNPTKIFFLTCDSFGVLPPLSKLNPAQAMYQFISGYTAKIAGTEQGIKSPKETFSACFGAPFMTLHPNKYALLLGQKIHDNQVETWMVNTGWTGGQYGVGKRIDLNHTRALISAVFTNQFQHAKFETMPIFEFQIPTNCPGVPTEILNPMNTWLNKNDYHHELKNLANKFITNFKQYENQVDSSILNAQPKL
ncbi:MAG: phosphoenolpyruvate carboxykinase (ATP) [Alphaproteobacteria bacterium]|nr:phosphoenolpyruvate carboxykinase (ATP) [Alphaproteobacteria bacterium]